MRLLDEIVNFQAGHASHNLSFWA